MSRWAEIETTYRFQRYYTTNKLERKIFSPNNGTFPGDVSNAASRNTFPHELWVRKLSRMAVWKVSNVENQCHIPVTVLESQSRMANRENAKMKLFK